MYLDEYGRYRAANYKKPRVRSRSFEEWQETFNPATSAAPVSAAPTSAATTDTDPVNRDAGGGDVADNQAGRDTLPEYDNARDWFNAMTNTPSIFGAGVIADAIRGSGLFSAQEPSYTTVNGQVMNPGNPTIAEMRGARETNGAVTAANERAGISDGDYDAAIESGNEAFQGAAPEVEAEGAEVDRAEGGPVFNSPEQVPGPVVGPGGPKEDKVDANLSNGEFVSTTEATQTFGEDFLTGLNDIARNPQARGLMANPAFEQAKQEFLTNVNSLMAPTGAAAPMPGAPTPPPGEPPVEMPMGAQPGFAEGGKVSAGEYAAAKADLDRAIRGRDAARLNKSMGTGLMNNQGNYDAQVAAAQARLKQLQDDSRDFADGGMIESDPLRFLKDIESARASGTAGGTPKAPGTGFELVGKPYKTPGTGFTMIDEVGRGDGFSMLNESTSKPNSPPKPEPKGNGLMSSTEDFFDWLMDKYNKMRGLKSNVINDDPALEDKRPKPKLLEDDSYLKRSNNAKDITPREKAGVESTAGNIGKGLLSRVVGGPVAAAATMALDSKSLNAGEDDELKKADLTHGYNPKESRNKDDTASAPVEDEGKAHMREGMKEEAESLFKKPKKQDKPKKETSKEENKLSPNAGLGDALEFYKRKGADKFTWEGQTYVRSNDSPTGYVLN